MKEKKDIIKNIIIGILVLIIIAMVCVYFFAMKEEKCELPSDNVNLNIYYCEKVVENAEVTEVKTYIKEKISYDDTGKVKWTKTILVNKYIDKDKYAYLKEDKTLTDDNNEYRFDDDKLTVEMEPKEETILKDTDGKEIAIWYIEYIKSFEKNGYTCTKAES